MQYSVSMRRIGCYTLMLTLPLIAAATCHEPGAMPPVKRPGSLLMEGPESMVPQIPPSTAPAQKPSRSTEPSKAKQPALLAGVRSLRPFYARLQALSRGEIHRVRVSVWGDSHIAAELLVGRLRSSLQQQLGDGGPGFVLLGGPWRSYRHSAVKLGQSRGWRSERLWARYSRRRPKPRDDLFGIAGISVHSRRRAWAWAVPRGRASWASAELYYLRQPKGGKLVVLADDRRVKWLFTVASNKEPAYARFDLPEGTRRLELRTRSGEVRLFGLDLASDQPGVVCDTLGINGARAGTMLEWNEELMGDQLRHLAPDLVVLAYGSNEVDSEDLTRAAFAAEFESVLQRMKRLAPQAACLIVGPPDQARFNRDSSAYEIPVQLDGIVAEQRRVARLHGCAFFDQRAAMGGAGSVLGLVQRDPPMVRPDHIHLSNDGYAWMGDRIYQSLMEGYKRFEDSQPELPPAPAPASAPASAPVSAPTTVPSVTDQ